MFKSNLLHYQVFKGEDKIVHWCPVVFGISHNNVRKIELYQPQKFLSPNCSTVRTGYGVII